MPTDEWREQNQDKMRAYRREWYYKNVESSKERSRANRKLFLERVDALIAERKNKGCTRCDEKASCCLEFHHLEPSKKDMSISDMRKTGNFDRLVTELKKCVVLCANCHRKLHAGLLK